MSLSVSLEPLFPISVNQKQRLDVTHPKWLQTKRDPQIYCPASESLHAVQAAYHTIFNGTFWLASSAS